MNHVDKRGFTIIELMLAMGFISFLLLGIAMTIIQIGTVYNRGMSLKEVNQAAREIGSDVSRNLSAVEAISLDQDYVTTTAGGRLCLGTVSYIWNTGKAFESDDPTITWYGNDTAHTKKIHLVKIPDTSKIYCAKGGTGALNYLTITPDDVPKAQELLPEGDHSLNMHKFELSAEASAHDANTRQQLYVLDYTIGSGQVSTMNDDQSACKSPGEAGADIAYCNVQPFSIVIRAGNRV